MPACSRCGTTDDRHSIKCYQAMALGMAMGVEPRPTARPALTLDQIHTVIDQVKAEAAPEPLPGAATRRRDGETDDELVRRLRRQAETIRRLEGEVAKLQAQQLDLEPPVTHLPPDYYEGKVSAERLAQIEREVADLDASPHLDVEVLNPLNAVVTPKAEPAPAEATPEVPVGTGKKPLPGMRWAESNKAKIGVPGAWAKAETLAAEAAAQEFVDAHLVAAEGQRQDEAGRTWPAYLTAPELIAAYEAWAKANDKPNTKASPRMVGAAATKSPLVTGKKQGPRHGGSKPNCYLGVKLAVEQAAQVAETAPSAPEPETPKIEGTTESIRALMAKARAVKTEVIPEPSAEIPPGPDELAVKLAQLKRYGIGGEHGVSRPAAAAAVADLHPTGRDVWKWSPPQALAGVSDTELDSTAYQLLIKCMNGLPEEYGYDFSPDVLATSGFKQEDVDAALRQPQRVEIRPESWDKEKRYPVLGFYRGDVEVILGMRTPTKPRVIAAYWTSLLSADTNKHANRHGGGGSKKSTGLPTTPAQVLTRLRAAGCEIPDPVDEKPVEVTYKGQSLGKIMTARTTTKITAQTDYQRTLRKMQAIDRREPAMAG